MIHIYIGRRDQASFRFWAVHRFAYKGRGFYLFNAAVILGPKTHEVWVNYNDFTVLLTENHG